MPNVVSYLPVRLALGCSSVVPGAPLEQLARFPDAHVNQWLNEKPNRPPLT